MPLENALIALSVSENPDPASLGPGEIHLDEAVSRIARQLLANGAVIAYGGDLRPGGFSGQLFESAQARDFAGKPARKHIRNYLAWPVHLNLTQQKRAELGNIAELIELSPPKGLVKDPDTFIAPDSVANAYLWARSLTAMRDRMTRDLAARILLGGRVEGYNGRYPGLAEEALLAIRTKKPLYLVGGYGGCTRAVIDVLRGATPPRLSLEFQAHLPKYAGLIKYYNKREKDDPIDYERLCAEFVAAGIQGLNNGLDEKDNDRLFDSDNLDEIIALLMKGLSAIERSHNRS
jgi:hypothetical protein